MVGGLCGFPEIVIQEISRGDEKGFEKMGNETMGEWTRRVDYDIYSAFGLV